MRFDLNAGRAAVLRALCQQEAYRKLVEESGWSPDKYETWLFDALKEQLLPPEVPNA